MARAFRPEFLNRIDRTVVFRPLSRPIMREILSGELEAVLARRGLRGRQWAVEFDDSALEFLLAEGFTPDLGARPLKRAVERHFLTPLALAIAGHDVPGGDQFLFVRAGGDGLKVTFVDPDAPAADAAPSSAAVSLRTLAREGNGSLDVLEEAFAAVALASRPTAGTPRRPSCWRGWASRASGRTRAASPCSRGSSCATASRPGWRSARSLMGRIRSARRQPSELVRRAAQRVLLLGEALDALEAGEPADAVLRVDGDPEFAPRIVGDVPRLGARARDAAGGRDRDDRSPLPLVGLGHRLRRAAGRCGRRRGCTSSRPRTGAAATSGGACA